MSIFHDVVESYELFRSVFDGGISLLLKSLGDNIRIFIDTCDHDIIDYLKTAVRMRIDLVDTLIKNELGVLNKGLSNIVSFVKTYGWETLIDSLKQQLYNARGQLMGHLLKKISKLQFSCPGLNLGDTYSYGMQMFIGPVPLSFKFSFSWALWFKMFFGLFDKTSFGASFNLGSSSDISASAGVGLTWCQVRGYIKGVLAHIEANFNVGLNLLRYKMTTSLCFSGEFGSVSVGVELYISIRIFFISVVVTKNFFGPFLIIHPSTFYTCPLWKELG